MEPLSCSSAANIVRPLSAVSNNGKHVKLLSYGRQLRESLCSVPAAGAGPATGGGCAPWCCAGTEVPQRLKSGNAQKDTPPLANREGCKASGAPGCPISTKETGCGERHRAEADG